MGLPALGLFRFSASKVPTKCGGASDTTGYSLPGYFGLPIKNGGKFHIKDSPSGFRDDSLFVMRGKLRGHGRAKGSLPHRRRLRLHAHLRHGAPRLEGAQVSAAYEGGGVAGG